MRINFPDLVTRRESTSESMPSSANAFGGRGGESIGIGEHAWTGPSTCPHTGILLNESERPADVYFLCFDPMPQGQQLGRVVHAVSDDRGVRDQRPKRLPDLLILARE